MIDLYELRNFVESENKPGGGGNASFRRHINKLLGVTLDNNGQKILKDPRVAPKEFGGLEEIFEAMVGKEIIRAHKNQMLESAIGPSHFIQINAFSNVVTALFDRIQLEQSQRANLIGRSLVTIETGVEENGGQISGLTGVPVSSVRQVQPGEEYPAAGFDPTWIEVPKNARFGHSMSLTFETLLYRKGQDFLGQAAKYLEAVELHEELSILRTILGITSSYKQDGNAVNATYQTSAGTAPYQYVNKIQNALADWSDVNNAIQLLLNIKDPHTNEAITSNPTTLLVMPAMLTTADGILHATSRTVKTNSGNDERTMTNGLGNYELLSNIRARDLLDAEGGITDVQADANWFFGDFKRAFHYREVFAPRVKAAEPTSRDIVMKELIGEWSFAYMGVPYVNNPRVVVQNTH